MRRLPLRTSTVILALVFAVAVTLYILYRPRPTVAGPVGAGATPVTTIVPPPATGGP